MTLSFSYIASSINVKVSYKDALCCAGLSESTKMRQRMVEMCVTVILLINLVEIKTT